MRTPLTTICLAIALQGAAQTPDGSNWHEDLPSSKVGNIVIGGANTEHAAKSMIWGSILQLGGTGIFAGLGGFNANDPSAAPWVFGAPVFSVGVVLDIHGKANLAKAGKNQQFGLTPDQWFDVMEDSLGQGEYRKIKVRDYYKGKKVHWPARFK